MTATGPNFFDTSHAQQDLQDWDRMAPVGREFGSPDYERLAELDHLAIKAKGSLLAARRWLDTSTHAEYQHTCYVLWPKRSLSPCVRATKRGRCSLPGPRWCSPS